MIYKYIVILIIAFLIVSCDGGLSPKPETEKSILSGTIHFVKGIDNWPSEDTVFAIRVAAFKVMPDSNIIAAIISGNAYFTGESLPMFVDSANFKVEIKDAPVNIVYIVAVWQFTIDITSQRVIGVYTLSGNKKEHSELFIENGKSYDIDIDVDFDDLPPMPF
ncbi:MAG: hypothetical protein RO257_16510 [Candidatus Kapabacteria bacterium]|nr:hypothetical protein [Candidatus Kapabacteria bacterium]